MHLQNILAVPLLLSDSALQQLTCFQAGKHYALIYIPTGLAEHKI